MKLFRFKELPGNRGEIATAILLIGMGVVALGIAAGNYVIQQRTSTNTRAQDIGAQACIPQTEICDAFDNDCDGNVDEGLNCTTGSPRVRVKVQNATGQPVNAAQLFRLECSTGHVGCTDNTRVDTCTQDQTQSGIAEHLFTMSTSGRCRSGAGAVIDISRYELLSIEDYPGGAVHDDSLVIPNMERVAVWTPWSAGERTIVYTVRDKNTTTCSPQTEYCDGRDNNCDGNVDEGLTCTTGTAQVHVKVQDEAGQPINALRLHRLECIPGTHAGCTDYAQILSCRHDLIQSARAEHVFNVSTTGTCLSGVGMAYDKTRYQLVGKYGYTSTFVSDDFTSSISNEISEGMVWTPWTAGQRTVVYTLRDLTTTAPTPTGTPTPTTRPPTATPTPTPRSCNITCTSSSQCPVGLTCIAGSCACTTAGCVCPATPTPTRTPTPTATRTPTPTPTPNRDLRIQSFSVSPTSISLGGSATVTYVIGNPGTVASNNVVLRRRAVVGSSPSWGPVDMTINLAAGAQSNPITETFTPTQSGTHTITLTIDPNNVISETVETNNTGTVTLTVVVPTATPTRTPTPTPTRTPTPTATRTPTPTPHRDLRIESYTVSPSTISLGGSATITYVIGNPGTVASNNIALRHRAVVGTTTVWSPADGTINLAAGAQSNPLTATFTPTQSGSHTLRLIIDPNNVISETVETNNTSTRTLTVVVPTSTPTRTPTPTITSTPTPTITSTPTLTPTGTLTPTTDPCPNFTLGNATCDSTGLVDSLDFVCWVGYYHLEVTGLYTPDDISATCRRSDFNGDNRISVTDFSIWQLNFIKQKEN